MCFNEFLLLFLLFVTCVMYFCLAQVVDKLIRNKCCDFLILSRDVYVSMKRKLNLGLEQTAKNALLAKGRRKTR